MSAQVINLEVEQGSTWRFQMNWKNADGTPINLTGCSALSHWRTSIDDPTILLTLSTENNRVVLDAATGSITLKLSAIETASIAFTSAVYDLEIYFPSNGGEIPVYRLIKGKVKVLKEITRG